MFQDEFDLVGFKSDVHGIPVDLTKKQRKRQRRQLRHKRFAAGLAVDLAQSCDFFPSVVVLSGASVGSIVDLLHANTHTQVVVMGVQLSGPTPFLIQTSDGITSGSFTDPTSGLTGFPLYGGVVSGGIFWTNSGLRASGNQAGLHNQTNNAPLFASGGIAFTSFQRPHRYARLMTLSGDAAILTGGFLGQKKTTGSGGGFTFAPGSGSVSV